MAKVASNPGSKFDRSGAYALLFADWLTNQEREERRKALQSFYMSNYDRDQVFDDFKLDATKPSDEAFIRAYHEWADDINVEALKDDNHAWLLGKEREERREALHSLGMRHYSNAHLREWLNSPARRVVPPSSAKPADLPPEFESGNGYDWCDSCGVHFHAEALKRHKKSVVHRANVMQYARWTASLKAKEAERASPRSQQSMPRFESLFQPGFIDERTLAAAFETSKADFSNVNPDFIKSVTRMLTDGDMRTHFRALEQDSFKVFTDDPKTGKPGTLHTCGAWTLSTEELARRCFVDTLKNGAKVTENQRRRVNGLRIASLLAVKDKAADPASLANTWSMFKLMVPDTLHAAEREAREETIHTFSTFKFDRSKMIPKLGLDATTPIGRYMIRIYHEWADGLDIESMRTVSNMWMLGKSARTRKFGLYILDVDRKADFLMAMSARNSRST
ncbi:hypothetical protein H9P43_008820 [Blastocladiella emersonii ATCC 22665]|nr:hypothetical protein H9P43_008820 [Blastocladiella emersonii ATCC 22665]